MDLLNNSFPGGQTAPEPKQRGNTTLIVVVLLLVVAVVALGYFYLGSLFNNQNADFPDRQHTPNSNQNTPTSTTPTSTAGVLNVTWQKPEKINDVALYVTDLPAAASTTYSYSYATAVYYKVGVVNNKQSDQIIMASVSFDGPGGPMYMMLRRYNGSLFILSRYSQSYAERGSATSSPYGQIDVSGMLLAAVADDPSTVIPDLEFPQEIYGSSTRQKLTLDRVRGFDTNSIFYTPAENQDQNAVYVPAFTDNKIGQVLTTTSTNGFYVIHGPLVAIYSFKPDFFDADYLIPNIVFNDGTRNTAQYSYTERGGCGSVNYLQVVSPSDISIEKDLVAVGKNSKGDTIYALKNSNHPWLKSLFENYPADPKQIYSVFLSNRPLLYWVDPFGRLVELQNSLYQPQAECGKPVIYLYPPATVNATVKVMPKNGMTFSDPKYNNGWVVKAEPNGALTELSTGKHYPYLYWEGRGSMYEQPKEGWVVKKENVPTFIRQKLLKLGLNHDEAADFEDFWLPRMKAKPYYFITFMGNRTMNDLAPLSIDPMPDTVIRILMDFTPLDKPIAVKPFNIYTPVRRGFTVVEWGGVLR